MVLDFIRVGIKAAELFEITTMQDGYTYYPKALMDYFLAKEVIEAMAIYCAAYGAERLKSCFFNFSSQIFLR